VGSASKHANNSRADLSRNINTTNSTKKFTESTKLLTHMQPTDYTNDRIFCQNHPARSLFNQPEGHKQTLASSIHNNEHYIQQYDPLFPAPYTTYTDPATTSDIMHLQNTNHINEANESVAHFEAIIMRRLRDLENQIKQSPPRTDVLSDGPLIPELYGTTIPPNADIPSLGNFGSSKSCFSDPKAFLVSFRERQRLMGFGDSVLCRLFPTCLEGSAWD
jgi:hypothetical protein